MNPAQRNPLATRRDKGVEEGHSYRKRLVRVVILVGVSLTVIAGGAAAGEARSVAFRPPGSDKAPERVDGRLAVVERAGARGVAVARAAGLDVSDRRVRVIVRATSVSGAKTGVASLGGEVLGSYANLVEAFVPPGAIRALSHASGVRSVRAPAIHQALGVDEGVAGIHADAWQSAGLTGTGVKVAVIDVGFQGWSSVVPGATLVNEDCDNPEGDQHGTAVAQLVHAIAPDAQIYLICMQSEVGLGEAEQYVLAHGITIVNHSVGWFGTSRGDGTGADGTPDAIVLDAREHGVLWVNAAGNSAAGDAWNGTMTDTNGDSLLEWSPGQPFNGISLDDGATDCGVLRWDDWPVTSQDYDLYLVDGDGNVVAYSTTDQASSPSEPTEGVCYTNDTGAQMNLYWVVVRYSATDNPRFDFYSIAQTAGVSALQFSTPGSTVSEPATSPAALAVGATCWQSGALEPYSSRGPTIDGRHKPDLSAPDGVSGTVYGDSTGCNDGSGFEGTSAAAPQVAGAAALLAQARPGLDVDQLETQVLDEFSISLGDFGGRVLWLHGPTFANPIAFGTGGDAEIANGDGTNPDTLASGGPADSAVVSPDGTKIAFSMAKGGTYQVYVANVDGSGRTQLTNGNDPTNSPTWSPDGTQIAYGTGGNTPSVYVANADGSGIPTLLTTGFDPAWHGSKIAFTDIVNEGGYIHYDIFSINTNGTGRTNLTNHYNAMSDNAAWSPDGSQIAFWTNPVPQGAAVMNADGSNIQFILSSVGPPSWSPDGTKLVAQSAGGLATMNPDGTDLFQIGDPSAGRPQWSQSVVVPFADLPSIQGDPRVGRLLYAPQPGWIGAAPGATSYQWRRDGVNIAGATSAVYLLQPADAGKKITVAVTATSLAGSRTLASAPTTPVSVAAPYVSTLPAVSGAAEVDQSLTGTTGSWVGSPTSYAFQWRRCDPLGGECTDIPNAKSATYKVAPDDVGSTIRLSVVATNPGGSDAAASVAFPSSGTVPPANQTISFGALVARTYGDPDFAVSATASSGLPVSFAASGNCTVSGASVHITGAGSCTITASQSGSQAYNPAPGVAETFSIAKAGQTITFGPLPNRGWGDAAFAIGATASSGLPVTLAANGDCTLSGATVDLTGMGSCTITGSQPGNTDYQAGAESQSFLILCRAPKVVGTKLSAAKAAILRRGCRTGTVRRAYSRSIRTGRVSSQSRRASHLVPRHARINLVVSRGRRS